MDFLLPKANFKVSKLTCKEFDKLEAKDRKRALLYLIESYLRDHNLHASADSLASEAQLSNQFELCDNVDLDMVLQDYHSFYFARFAKYPKVLKKSSSDASGSTHSPAKGRLAKPPIRPANPNNSNNVRTSAQGAPRKCELHVDVMCLQSGHDSCQERQDKQLDGRIPALSDFEGYSSEWREMADLITREIVSKKPRTSWADCVGLGHCIDLLKEAVVYPLAYPDAFKGLLAPWRGVLLFGPPGTGKTLLARVLAAESRATFINLTISSFVSKWRGESEKMLKVLFDVARLYAPTTIFIDELDALASRHEDNQHDASRRFKSELLVQMDGLLCNEPEDNGVFVLATTNSPWHLCAPILRRFEKRIFVNVPDQGGRMDLYEYYFNQHPANNFARGDYKEMANMSAHFSGADIKHVCREVSMNGLRGKLPELRDSTPAKLQSPTLEEVKRALRKIHPVSDDVQLQKYRDWEKLFGCM